MKKYLMPLYNWFFAVVRKMNRIISFRMSSKYYWDKTSNEVLFI
jgi:hypothetical protein